MKQRRTWADDLLRPRRSPAGKRNGASKGPQNQEYVPDVPRILAAWEARRSLSQKEAAATVGIPFGSYRGYRERRIPLRGKNLNSVLKALESSSLEKAALRYDHETPRAEVFDDFYKESEEVFIAHLADAKVIRETRLMLSSYAAIDKASPDRAYRANLNRLVRRRVLDGQLSIRRIEQLSRFERCVDLLLNIRDFGLSPYDVRIFENTEFLVPYLNFTIFDDRSIICGGFHTDEGPPRYPFLSLVGGRFVTFYEAVYEKLHHAAKPFSALPTREQYEIAKRELNKLPAHKASPITVDQLNAAVIERAKAVEEVPPRW